MGGKRRGRCVMAEAMINLILKACLEEYATAQQNPYDIKITGWARLFRRELPESLFRSFAAAA
jgi:hypothetical protein